VSHRVEQFLFQIDFDPPRIVVNVRDQFMFRFQSIAVTQEYGLGVLKFRRPGRRIARRVGFCQRVGEFVVKSFKDLVEPFHILVNLGDQRGILAGEFLFDRLLKLLEVPRDPPLRLLPKWLEASADGLAPTRPGVSPPTLPSWRSAAARAARGCISSSLIGGSQDGLSSIERTLCSNLPHDIQHYRDTLSVL